MRKFLLTVMNLITGYDVVDLTTMGLLVQILLGNAILLLLPWPFLVCDQFLACVFRMISITTVYVVHGIEAEYKGEKGTEEAVNLVQVECMMELITLIMIYIHLPRPAIISSIVTFLLSVYNLLWFKNKFLIYFLLPYAVWLALLTTLSIHSMWTGSARIDRVWVRYRTSRA